MYRRSLATAALLAAGAAGFWVGLGEARAQDRPHAFLELFTSQGCSSCPAADRLVKRFADEEGVLAVTMPVQIWDFLGWPDTLASDETTKRQIAYSVARGDRDVYTPQMVVNGSEAVLGSDANAIEAAFDAHDPQPLPIPIDLSVRGGILNIKVGEADRAIGRATLWLLVVDEEVRVPVKGGENRGRKLTYHNVVREMRPVGMWKGDALTLDLPLSDQERAEDVGCYVIAQVETFRGPGEIVGAAKLDRLFPARSVEAARR